MIKAGFHAGWLRAGYHWFWLWLALLAGTPVAKAHPNLQNAMWVQFEPGRVRVAVTVSLRELNVTEGLALPEAGGLPPELSRAAGQHGDYLLHHLALTAGTKALAGRVTKVTLPVQPGEPEATFCEYDLAYPWEPTPAVTFCQTMLQEWPYALGTPWEVSYSVRTKRLDGLAAGVWLLVRETAVPCPTGWQPAVARGPVVSAGPGGDPFQDYFVHGVGHILTGYDHLLFVSALVLATVSFWEMFQVIAVFTLAHTLTLTLCVLGICRLPAWVVEPVIALSIVLVALENVWFPQRAHSAARLGLAFGFGLVHGLGFAGGLLDAMAGLPGAGVWTALGAFSLGVETGHQLVVLPLFCLLAWSRHYCPAAPQTRWRQRGSLVVAAGGAYFLVVAVREQFWT